MTSTNNPLNRAQPSAPSSTYALPIKMRTVQFPLYSSSGPIEGADTLSRVQDNVSDCVDALLENANYAPGTPIALSFPASAFGAGMSGAVIYKIPLMDEARLYGMAVSASAAPSAGSGAINLGGMQCTITAGLVSGQLVQPLRYGLVTNTRGQSGTVAQPPIPTLTATTSAAWSFTGTVWVSVYLR